LARLTLAFRGPLCYNKHGGPRWLLGGTDYPFDYDINVYIAADDHFETAYYTHNKKAYKRHRQLGRQEWEDTTPVEITHEEFLMLVACVNRARLW
jgi:hypothetical protein